MKKITNPIVIYVIIGVAYIILLTTVEKVFDFQFAVLVGISMTLADTVGIQFGKTKICLEGQWISVKERLPAVGDDVIVIIGQDTWLRGMLLHDKTWKVLYADGENYVKFDDIRPVRYWRPAPEIPKKISDEKY